MQIGDVDYQFFYIRRNKETKEYVVIDQKECFYSAYGDKYGYFQDYMICFYDITSGERFIMQESTFLLYYTDSYIRPRKIGEENIEKLKKLMKKIGVRNS